MPGLSGARYVMQDPVHARQTAHCLLFLPTLVLHSTFLLYHFLGHTFLVLILLLLCLPQSLATVTSITTVSANSSTSLSCHWKHSYPSCSPQSGRGHPDASPPALSSLQPLVPISILLFKSLKITFLCIYIVIWG